MEKTMRPLRIMKNFAHLAYEILRRFRRSYEAALVDLIAAALKPSWKEGLKLLGPALMPCLDAILILHWASLANSVHQIIQSSVSLRTKLHLATNVRILTP